MWLRLSKKPQNRKGLFSATVDAWLDRPRNLLVKWPLEEESAQDEERTRPIYPDDALQPPLPSDCLVRIMGGQYQDIWTLPRDRPVLVGRSVPDQSIEIDIDLAPDLTVSRAHARLWYTGEHWWIEDTKSANGTWLGPQDIRGHGAIPLPIGSTLLVGQTILIFAPQE